MYRTRRLPSKLSIEQRTADADADADDENGIISSLHAKPVRQSTIDSAGSCDSTDSFGSGNGSDFSELSSDTSSTTAIGLVVPTIKFSADDSYGYGSRSGGASHVGHSSRSHLGRMNEIYSFNQDGTSELYQEGSTSKERSETSSRDSNADTPLANDPQTNLRPSMIRFHSSPVVSTLSPTRHQFRLPNLTPREIKETLNASFKEDEFGRSINQYTVKEVIGRGSFGMVRLAIDENTKTKYAIKEYSKQRLKKLNRSETMLLRRKGMLGRGRGDLLPDSTTSNPIDLIRREVAIMKKLDHLNIVNLIEVLDDPNGDSLYVILEWCEKGVIMPLPGSPNAHYDEEQCRLYFRDMILGVEYLHSQGIIHRDIKAENVLVSEADVVKIVDFGVSEMFEKDNDAIKKTAGSPAYMAPELIFMGGGGSSSKNSAVEAARVSAKVAVTQISGRAADIWSMGVTLYYMRFGYLPFQADTLGELYDKILNSEPVFEVDCDRELKDLLLKILEKDPHKRIVMSELREHPWVTCSGKDLLLSMEENSADSITPVTEEDLFSAFELIQGVMDVDQANDKLWKLHGWRGSLGSGGSGISRESSRSPVSTLSDGGSMFKLTRALNEILSKDRRKDEAAFQSSRSTGTSPLIEAYLPESIPTAVSLDRNSYFGEESAQSEEVAVATTTTATSTVTRTATATDSSLLELELAAAGVGHETQATRQQDYDNESNADLSDSNEIDIERRPSRTRSRQFLGLEMTSLRSRSLDTDDRY